MRLAVEVSTCSAERTGIGYYTEHFVDALLATRSAGDDVVLISNGKPAPELYDRWRDQLRIGGVPVRAIWMQRDANRMLVENGADFAMFPNYLAPLNVVCPFVERRPRSGDHPHAGVLQPRQAGDPAAAAAADRAAGGRRRRRCRRRRAGTSWSCSASPSIGC